MARMQDPSNYNEWVNVSEGLEFIPARRSLIQALGLFSPEYLETKRTFIPLVSIDDYTMVDTPYGVRMQTALRDSKSQLPFDVPHFATTDSVRPADIQGKYEWDDFMLSTRAATVEYEVNKKKARHVQTMVNTKDKAMLQLITEGTVYAPNGTVVNNLYTAFDVIRTDTTISLAPDSDLSTQIQGLIDGITDNFKGGFVPTRFVALAGRKFFDTLKAHPYVVDVCKAIVDTVSIENLRGRLGVAVADGTSNRDTYQVMELFGVTFIRCNPNEIAIDEIRMMPVDIPDMFKVLYAPSDLTFDTVNQPAQDMYYFEKAESDRTAINMTYETNFACVTLWPKAIIKVTATYA